VKVPLFAYHFGAPYEVDEDENILGDWKPVGEMILRFDDVFLIFANGSLPPEKDHLLLIKYPEPTGRKTVRWTA
jgi:hypothetical protein